jgi:hypothetical protein
VTVAVYAIEVEQGWEPSLNHEHDEHRWCTFDEALELLYWPEVRDGLRDAARRFRPSSGRRA